jgi:hypothetical protein
VAGFFASPGLRIGRDAMTEVAGSPDGGSHMSYWEWQLPRARQWVHVRQPFGLLPGVADYERVTVVSGSCLFSARSVRLVPEDGRAGPSLLSPFDGTLDRAVAGIAVDERLTLYEYELEARLTRAIADVVDLIPSSTELRLVLDVPRVQYYFLVLDGFDAGLIPPEVALQWFDHVDARRSLVVERLRRGLAARGIERAFEVCTETVLDPLARSIRAAVREGRPLQASALAAAEPLVSSPLWRQLLRVSPPVSFGELSHLSYAAELLQAGTRRTGEPASLGLVVDSPREHKILARARTLAKSLLRDDPQLVTALLGLYCEERLMLARDGARVALYLGDPGTDLTDEHGTPLDAFALVDELYGGSDARVDNPARGASTPASTTEVDTAALCKS